MWVGGSCDSGSKGFEVGIASSSVRGLIVGTAAEAVWSNFVVRKAGNDVDWIGNLQETEQTVY
jgi:hypothetical protein